MGADISIENDTRDEWLIKMTAPTPKGIKRLEEMGEKK